MTDFPSSSSSASSASRAVSTLSGITALPNRALQPSRSFLPVVRRHDFDNPFASGSKATPAYRPPSPKLPVILRNPTINPVYASAASSVHTSLSPASNVDRQPSRHRTEVYIEITNLGLIKSDPTWKRLRETYYARREAALEKKRLKNVRLEVDGKGKGKAKASPIHYEIIDDEDAYDEQQVNQVLGMDIESPAFGPSRPRSRSGSLTLVQDVRRRKRQHSSLKTDDESDSHSLVSTRRTSLNLPRKRVASHKWIAVGDAGDFDLILDVPKARDDADDEYIPSDAEVVRPKFSSPKTARTTPKLLRLKLSQEAKRPSTPSITISPRVQPKGEPTVTRLDRQGHVQGRSSCPIELSSSSDDEPLARTTVPLSSGWKEPDVITISDSSLSDLDSEDQPLSPTARTSSMRRPKTPSWVDSDDEPLTSLLPLKKTPIKGSLKKIRPSPSSPSYLPSSSLSRPKKRVPHDSDVDSPPPSPVKRSKLTHPVRKDFAALKNDGDDEDSDWSRGNKAATERLPAKPVGTIVGKAKMRKWEALRPPTRLSDEVRLEGEQNGTLMEKYCHMCRSRQLTILCTGMAIRKKKSETCMLGFCDRCLSKYDLPFDPQSLFICPVCQGVCVCSSCSRKALPVVPKVASKSPPLTSRRVRRLTEKAREGDASTARSRRKASVFASSRGTDFDSDGGESDYDRSKTLASTTELPIPSPTSSLRLIPPDYNPFGPEQKSLSPSPNNDLSPLFKIDETQPGPSSRNADDDSNYGPEQWVPQSPFVIGETLAGGVSPMLFSQGLPCSPSTLFRASPTGSFTRLRRPQTPQERPQTPTKKATSPPSSSWSPIAIGLTPPSSSKQQSFITVPSPTSPSPARYSQPTMSFDNLEQQMSVHRKYGFLSLDPAVVIPGQTWTGGVGMFAFEDGRVGGRPSRADLTMNNNGGAATADFVRGSGASGYDVIDQFWVHGGEFGVSLDQLELKKCVQQDDQVEMSGVVVVTPTHEPEIEMDREPAADDEELSSPTEVDELTPSNSVETVLPEESDEYTSAEHRSVEKKGSHRDGSRHVFQGSAIGGPGPLSSSNPNVIVGALAALLANGHDIVS